MDTHSLPIIVRIGKAGITDTIIAEIKKQIRKRKVLKVKFLPAHAAGKDKKAFAKELAEKTGTLLVSQIGFVAVLKEIPQGMRSQ
jgi:RNA-binding protein YhbY